MTKRISNYSHLFGWIIICFPLAFSCSSNKSESAEEKSCPKVLLDDLFRQELPVCSYYVLSEAENEAKKDGKNLLIWFTAHGMYSSLWEKGVLLGDSDLWQIVKEHYVLVQLYLDDRTVLPKEHWQPFGQDTLKELGRINEIVQESFGHQGLPHFVVQSSDGKFLDELVAWKGTEELRSLLKRCVRQ